VEGGLRVAGRVKLSTSSNAKSFPQSGCSWLTGDFVANMKRGILLRAESRLERVSSLGFSVSAI
jgi:hypothetical protein